MDHLEFIKFGLFFRAVQPTLARNATLFPHQLFIFHCGALRSHDDQLSIDCPVHLLRSLHALFLRLFKLIAIELVCRRSQIARVLILNRALLRRLSSRLSENDGAYINLGLNLFVVFGMELDIADWRGFK